jgi:hypothetical protein
MCGLLDPTVRIRAPDLDEGIAVGVAALCQGPRSPQSDAGCYCAARAGAGALVRAIRDLAERIGSNDTSTLTRRLRECQLSLHTIVQGSFAGRLRLRRPVAGRAATSTVVPLRISIGSMRILETCLALGAIATALLIGLGR